MIEVAEGRRGDRAASSARSTRPGSWSSRSTLVEPTLDDVFVEKTGQHLEGAEAAGEPGTGETEAVAG